MTGHVDMYQSGCFSRTNGKKEIDLSKPIRNTSGIQIHLMYIHHPTHTLSFSQLNPSSFFDILLILLISLLQKPILQVRPRLLHSPRLICEVRLSLTILAGLSAALGTRGGHLVGGVFQRFEQLHGGLGGKVLVVLVVDLDHRRVDAGAEAFDLEEGEEAVGRGLALLDVEVLLDGLDDGVGAASAELARGLNPSVSNLKCPCV